MEWRAWPRESLRYVGWFLGGLAVSVVNPLGARLLTFPLTLLAVQSYYQQMAIGAVLILAVFIDQYQVRKESRV